MMDINYLKYDWIICEAIEMYRPIFFFPPTTPTYIYAKGLSELSLCIAERRIVCHRVSERSDCASRVSPRDVRLLHRASVSGVFVRWLHRASVGGVFVRWLHRASVSGVFVRLLHRASVGGPVCAPCVGDHLRSDCAIIWVPTCGCERSNGAYGSM